VEKKPIKNSKYLALQKGASGPFFNLSFIRIKIVPKMRYREPWPISPNIIPKRNGKVAIAIGAGLASKYVGIPYISTSA